MCHICVTENWIFICMNNGLSLICFLSIMKTNGDLWVTRPNRMLFNKLLSKFRYLIHWGLITSYVLRNVIIVGQLNPWEHISVNLNRNTVECLYNAVQYNMVFHSPLNWPTQNINQTLDSQKTLHSSPSRASYGVSIVNILEKIDRVITAPQWLPINKIHLKMSAIRSGPDVVNKTPLLNLSFTGSVPSWPRQWVIVRYTVDYTLNNFNTLRPR